MPHDWFKAEWNATIAFGAGRPTRHFLLDGGWCGDEPGGIWTNGVAARMAFRLPPPRNQAILVLEGAPFLAVGKRSSQLVRVAVNNVPVGELTLTSTDRGLIAMPVPAAVLAREAVCVVSLSLPGTRSPLSTGQSTDPRLLAFHLSALRWADLWCGYQLGAHIFTSSFRRPGSYMLHGWSHAEERFTWTEGELSALLLHLDQPSQGLVFRARMHAYLPTPGLPPQRVRVRINGQPAATLWFPDSRPRIVEVPVPDGLAGNLMLEFAVAEPRSPLSCGCGADPRRLGLGLSEFWMEAQTPVECGGVFAGWTAPAMLETPASGGALVAGADLAFSRGPVLLRCQVSGAPVHVTAGGMPAGVLDEESGDVTLFPSMIRRDGPTLLVFESEDGPSRLRSLHAEPASGGRWLSGWCAVSGEAARSDGGACEIAVPTQGLRLPLCLELSLNDFDTAPDKPCSRLRYELNGRVIGSVPAEAAGAVRLSMDLSPADLLDGAPAVLRLVPDADDTALETLTERGLEIAAAELRALREANPPAPPRLWFTVRQVRVKECEKAR